MEKAINRIEPSNQRRDDRQISLNPITKAIAPAAKAVAPRINSLGVLTGSVTEPQRTKTVVKAAPKEIYRAKLFSLLKVNMQAILLKKRPKPGPLRRGNRVSVLELLKIEANYLAASFITNLVR